MDLRRNIVPILAVSAIVVVSVLLGWLLYNRLTEVALGFRRLRELILAWLESIGWDRVRLRERVMCNDV